MAKKSESKSATKAEKVPKTKSSVDAMDEDAAPFNPANLTPVAHPLANAKLCKKLLKTVKKAAKQKHVKRGVKEVVKALRKGEKGLVLLAGDVSPLDVLSHLPVMCEDASIPYVYVPSKKELGAAGSTKRPTSVVLLPVVKKAGADYEESYDACVKEVQGLPIMPSAMA